MRVRTLTGIVTAAFLVLALCATLHHGGAEHSDTVAQSTHCCASTPSSSIFIISNFAQAIYLTPVFFIFAIVFLIPSKVTVSLYHPPRP